MKKLLAAVVLIAVIAAAAVILMRKAPRPHAIVEFPAAASLTVTTPAWQAGGDIPFENTQYRGNVFPGLAWTAGPAGTQSYVVIMQDTDSGKAPEPILHWTMYNIPAGVTALPAAMAPEAKPEGSSYGPNYNGPDQPYLGPLTPPGPKHHYHLQVFALDKTLTAEPTLDFNGLTAQMKGHVLASGEVVGLGQHDPSAPKE